jgi:hypothetical protein
MAEIRARMGDDSISARTAGADSPTAHAGDGFAPANGTVTTPKIADGAVTDAKLDPDGVISRVALLAEAIESIDAEIDPDDLGLEVVEEGDREWLYPTYRGVRSSNGVPYEAKGGGGGGGGSSTAAVMTATNDTGWVSTTIASGAVCIARFTWTSIEDGSSTGSGTLSVSVNDIQKLNRTVDQGTLAIDLTDMLVMGQNTVRVRISDVYGQTKAFVLRVAVAAVSIQSSFDVSGTFVAGAPIQYTYTPIGTLEKTVYFVVDGQTADMATVTTSGRQQTQALPSMSHGAHTLLVYLTCQVAGAVIRSNELYYSLIVVSPTSNTPIVSTSFRQTSATQYETLSIPYRVYTPNSLTSVVSLSVNNVITQQLTVDRTEHVWPYRCLSVGSVNLSISTVGASVPFAVQVSASDIDVEPETESLALHLTSYGRSNSEDNPSTWSFGNISCTLSNFNFVSDGWVLDDDGNTVLRVSNDARVTIPYKPFQTDFRTTGKTLEFEFATRDVYDYDATVISCWSGNRGFKLTAQQATLASEQSSISMQYKEDEHVRITFVVEKRAGSRLLILYVNGIASSCMQYPDDDNFQQMSPVNITIGSNNCTTDIYNIRVYDNDLTRYQVIRNWIADTQDIDLMLERYAHNDIYDEYGTVTIENLPSDLPYIVIECAELPQYKGDKKTCSGRYVDPVTPSKSFTFEGMQINVQGTSSSVYDIKNFDMQFKEGFVLADGTHADNYALAPNVIPFNRFVLKADVASSEGANNVELVKLYNEIDPYVRPEQVTDPRVRKGIYGFPIVMFWYDTNTGRLSLYGKMNFNLPKRAPGPYGYTGETESWEFQNNTSNLMLFLTDYFDETMLPDPDTGDEKETWRYDYEARFPSDEWTNYAKLQELQSFVYSTYRANATNDALATSVTYGGVTYTRDTADYRLAKFKAGFGRYAEIQSFLFYYVFTELFLMVDSRAKNLFIGFSGGTTTGLSAIDRKAICEPYDMDTSLGIEAA